jgi:hypothetical protein
MVKNGDKYFKLEKIDRKKLTNGESGHILVYGYVQTGGLS